MERNSKHGVVNHDLRFMVDLFQIKSLRAPK